MLPLFLGSRGFLMFAGYRIAACGRCRSLRARRSRRSHWAAGTSSSARPKAGAKILVSIVSGPANRRLASIAVSASGEKLARSSRNRRISSSQSRSSSARVTRPSASASAASSGRPMSDELFERFRLAQETGRQPAPAVAHRERAGEIDIAKGDRGRRHVVAIGVTDQHEGTVGRKHDLGKRAGKARARLDQRHQRARREVDTLENAFPFEADLARQPMRDIAVEEFVVIEDGMGIALGLEQDHREVGLIEANIEDGVVQFARQPQRPERRALLQHGIGRIRNRPLRNCAA